MAACAVRARPGRSGSRRGAGRVGTRSYPATALASPPRRRRRERREEEEEEKGPGPDKTLWFFQGSEREGGQPRRDGAEEGMSGGFIAIERPGGGGSGAGAAAEVVGGVRSGVRLCPAPPAQPCPALSARGSGQRRSLCGDIWNLEPLAAGPWRLREPLAALSPSWLLCCAGLKLET